MTTSKLINLALIAVLILTTSCNSDSSKVINQESPRVPLESLISNLSNNVVHPATQKLASSTSDLEQALTTFCQDIGERDELTTEQRKMLLLPVQDAWKSSMTYYHMLEIMQYGPVKEPLSTAMKSLYTFDTSHKCRAEILISRKRAPNFSVTNEEDYKLIGLDLLEAFLFAKADESQCPRALPWMEKSLIERQKDVCAYTLPAAQNIKTVALRLEKRWSPRSGDYNGQILVSRTLGSPEAAMNKISQALFYLYGGIVDTKVTVPAGIQVSNNRVQSCDEASCPNRTEHQKSGYSVESLIAALDGFRVMFFGEDLNTGVNGLGFDDLLAEQNQSAIADQMRMSIKAAKSQLSKHIGVTNLTKLATNVDPVKCAETTSTNRLEEICAIDKDIEAVTNLLLRSEVILKGLLARPAGQQGDND